MCVCVECVKTTPFILSTVCHKLCGSSPLHWPFCVSVFYTRVAAVDYEAWEELLSFPVPPSSVPPSGASYLGASRICLMPALAAHKGTHALHFHVSFHVRRNKDQEPPKFQRSLHGKSQMLVGENVAKSRCWGRARIYKVAWKGGKLSNYCW